MAASWTATMTCRKCARTVTITNTTELADGNAKELVQKCPECGNPMGFWVSSVAITHTGNVGSFQTLTNTAAAPGTVSTAASNAA